MPKETKAAKGKRAIREAGEMRQTHVEWLEHLEPVGKGKVGRMRCDPCARAGMDKVVGDAAHQQDCIDRYDNILAALEDQK